MNDNDYAIVVGISRYPELGDNRTPLDLKGPENDADAMEEWFRSIGVGTIDKIKGAVVGENPEPTGDQIVAAMRRIVDIARQNQEQGKGLQVGRRLYIYMSGHGFSPARRRGCIFSADADDRFGNNVHVSSWLDWFQDAGYFREFVLWMDCCMNRVSLLPPREPPIQPQVSQIPPSATFIAFAAQRPLKAVEIPIPEDGNKWHGAFTWALLEGLRGAAVDANGRVSSRSLGDWIRNAQSSLLKPGDLNDQEVSKEPDVVQEDSRLIFARGIRPKTYPVTLSFAAALNGQEARLWSGRPPSAESFAIADGASTFALKPGLYVVDVPGARIRQGFEVLGPKHVEIQEDGDPITHADAGQVFSLDVQPLEQTAEIFVIDTAFSLVDGQPGRLATPLSFGLYKIKIRLAGQVKERVILLDRDNPPLEGQIMPSVPAAAPIAGTAFKHEYQEGEALAAFQTGQNLVRQTGRPALTVMTRIWSDDGPSAGTEPWNGIRVVDRRGKGVLDFSKDGMRHVEAGQDPYAVATVPLKVGTYFLRRLLPNQSEIEQSLVLTEGWTLETYILQRAVSGREELSRAQISLHLRKQGSDAPNAEEDRLLETAYVALADERCIFNREFEDLFFREIRNPLVGIVGAHLFLLNAERNRKRDLSLLDEIVTDLRALVGTDHPDVEALSLMCPSESLRTPTPVKSPPIFQRSWKLLTEATQDRPNLVPRNLWNRVQGVVPRRLYFAWLTDKEDKAASVQGLADAVWSGASLETPSAPVDVSTARRRALRLQVPLSALEPLRSAATTTPSQPMREPAREFAPARARFVSSSE